MKIFSALRALLRKPDPTAHTAADGKAAARRARSGRGLLVFQHTGEVIRAERLLRTAGLEAEVKGPPPQLRTGCDMVVVFELVSQARVLATLNAGGLTPAAVVCADDVLLEPVCTFTLRAPADAMGRIMGDMSRMKAELESYKNSLRVSFTTDSTEVLRSAKRLRYTPESTAPGPAKHPVFRIENGEIGVFDLTAGNRLTVDALLQVFREPRATGRPAPSRVVVHYADRSPAVEYLLTRLGELYPSATLYERPITLSIQVNLGRDIVGVVGD